MIKIISFPSPNYNDRPIGVNIDMLVLHYTGMPKTIHALERMCNPVAKVSAHYLIDADGQIFQLRKRKILFCCEDHHLSTESRVV